ncbi:respiratory nitrate reductase subunit gamma [Biformimicrobium ophioploci]|uniref:Respiratory nitrate reductase subunit gamma n=1 Tax=Biformimicrobium ophioploci TaxID=3036711 RepID=A0ABQ6M1X7_9GAMM|nr:respiratory nitrate reductase subunit gamma [Microbulbifer sp. NKW57]GMG88350.1 respiratory nitrate reductase subunit gamma [Microbulbifer sp. NKW57]
MADVINYLLFGWYPYVALTVLILGSIIRFDKGQYSWRSQSSQFLRRKQLMVGSNLFHLGVLILLFGHFVGLLTPIGVFDYFGISHGFKQLMALVVGGIAGVLAFIGCSMLLHRRLFDPRIRRSSSTGDILILLLLWLQIVLGLATTLWTIDHMDGSAMVLFMGWAQGVLTFDPKAADLIIDAQLVYKLHIVLGLTLFLVTPFSRLVHIWSAPIGYLLRPGYQVVRSRRLGREARPNVPGHAAPDAGPIARPEPPK